ncbi:aspartate racemase [Motiliproteus sp. MSK22-1]|nr:aspartate racemase [Motiliproteus sp. MSK22-1]
MGPLATMDFANKILSLTPAQCDQEHLPLLIHSVPQIPDRTAFLMQKAESPLPSLKQGLNTLISAGAGCIVIPCNTAHFWYPQLAAVSPVEILHIARIASKKLSDQKVKTAALLATDGTLKAGFYREVLESQGITCLSPGQRIQQQVMEGIYKVKSGQVVSGAKLLLDSANMMLDKGAEQIILGCTEIPIALDSIKSPIKEHSLDATLALAEACIEWHQQDNKQAL